MTYFSLQGLLYSSLVLVSFGLSGCAGAPVQEMSNARQAIRAARDAGTQHDAGMRQEEQQELAEAQALLDRAEDNLHKRAYRNARRDAIAARDKAAEILDAAQPSRHAEPGS